VDPPFEPEKYNRLLGTDVKADQMLGYFERLGLVYHEDTNRIDIPSFRQDLRCSADLAEEVARFFGYDNIPTTLPQGESTTGKKSLSGRVEDICRDVAEQNGFCGGMCYSFESPKVFDKLRIPEGDFLRDVVTISNPLGEDYSIMRTSLFNGMLTSLATNYNRRNKSASLFELANVYIPKALPLTELPDERMTLCFGFYGGGDFFDLKGALEQVLDDLGVMLPRKYEPDHDIPFFHPGRQALVTIKGGHEKIACLGQIHPLVAKKYGIGTNAYVAQLNAAGLDKIIADYEALLAE